MMERIGWLGLWLVFGLLAAQKVGLRWTASEIDPALAVLYAALGMWGLWMMVRRSLRARRPGRLALPMALSLAGPAFIALLIHQRKPPPEWIDTLLMACVFLAFSACAIGVGMVVAWRRREADRDRRQRDMQEWERRRLVERPSSGPLQQLVAELEHPPTLEDADLLPARILKG